MIHIQNVSFTYEQADTPSLKNINLSVKTGECVLLCGKSGCGKTTLIRLLCGMLPDFYNGAFTGSVSVKGIDPVTAPMYEIAKTVGTVFQNPRTQFYTVNTTSEIAFGCENFGMEPKLIQDRVYETADALHINSLLDRNIFQLSGGEKQKIAFASIYAVNPDIYVLDEPSSNLDNHAINELQSMLQFLKSHGKTIVIAEHRIRYLKELADRAVYMKEGQIEKEYTMQELDSMSIAERMETGIRPVSLGGFSSIMKEQSESSGDIGADASIQMKDVSFSYTKYTETPSLFIPEAYFPAGTVIAVTGNNGAGKSTLVSMIGGLLKNKKGTIRINGNIQSAKERLFVSYMVMQEVNHQLFTDSVKEEIVLGVKNPDEEALHTVLTKMDIERLKDRHPMTLSGGQKQRVAIAAAVFCKKKILIFDEPTSGLDFFHMMQTAELIKTLKADDTYIFVITHDYELIAAACDIAVEVKNGRIESQYVLNTSGFERLQNTMFS
ncbi:energy-coupling factor ABC transporter ATP-binding protein [Treponema sp. OMZ 803]|uniref:ABC transporter ATP-binding protein n=1 Tax=Treponema sp. OMZ 803 TaxID=120682 RepID=UPI0020A33E3B|nr:energy-coupling factor ABC transporter ATP-binding protein [Treponema sp. OMZ 803]UTC52778.1 energy-coupling factor ABC transporter ATP-binding protein [Treponema sp. OMZ 803]